MKSYSVQLHTAIRFKKFNEVVSAIDAGADINFLFRGITPVSCALYEKAYDILEYLVKKNANVNIRTQDDIMQPPLFFACHKNRKEAIQILLKSPNLDIDQKDFFKRSPLWAAVKAQSLETVELLLDNGADISYARDYIQCPLYQALILQGRMNPREITHLLIRRGCKINFRYPVETPLTFCAPIGDLQTFSLLVKSGCKIPKGGLLSEDALHASWRKDDSICQWIRSLPNTTQTLVHLAVCSIRETLVKTHKNIFPSHVKELPLPNHLKKCILFEE